MTEDRPILEQLIFSRYRADQRVLFVGVNKQTAGYPREFTTIDCDPSAQTFSAKHSVIALQDYDPTYKFDAIIVNGVLGWGLNELADCQRAFSNCVRMLARGGELVLGWNNVRPHNDVQPHQIAALRQLAIAHYETKTPLRHTFEIYRL